jgi:hypothetical protein
MQLAAQVVHTLIQHMDTVRIQAVPVTEQEIQERTVAQLLQQAEQIAVAVVVAAPTLAVKTLQVRADQV